MISGKKLASYTIEELKAERLELLDSLKEFQRQHGNPAFLYGIYDVESSMAMMSMSDLGQMSIHRRLEKINKELERRMGNEFKLEAFITAEADILVEIDPTPKSLGEKQEMLDPKKESKNPKLKALKEDRLKWLFSIAGISGDMTLDKDLIKLVEDAERLMDESAEWHAEEIRFIRYTAKHFREALHDQYGQIEYLGENAACSKIPALKKLKEIEKFKSKKSKKTSQAPSRGQMHSRYPGDDRLEGLLDTKYSGCRQIGE